MAEIRKHQPTIRNQIDAAIAAALGEDVRPVAPGAQPRPRSETSGRPADPASVPVTMPTAWMPLDPAVVARPLGRPAPARDDDRLDEPDDAD